MRKSNKHCNASDSLMMLVSELPTSAQLMVTQYISHSMASLTWTELSSLAGRDLSWDKLPMQHATLHYACVIRVGRR